MQQPVGAATCSGTEQSGKASTRAGLPAQSSPAGRSGVLQITQTAWAVTLPSITSLTAPEVSLMLFLSHLPVRDDFHKFAWRVFWFYLS